MSRASVFPVEDKVRIVMSILAGEVTVAEAARRAEVFEQSVGSWKRQFLEAGKLGLAPGGASRPSSREERLAVQVEDLTSALGEGACRVAGVEEVRGGPPGPFEDLEVIRHDAAMPVSRFCQLTGIPRRTYHRWLARYRRGGPSGKGPWPAREVERIEPVAAKFAADWPAWGHRKIHALMAASGHAISVLTVERAMRRRHLLQPVDYRGQRRELAKARKGRLR